MLTELITGERAFTVLAAEWDPLVQRSMTNTPFQLLAYQHPEQGSLHTITVREENGRLLAIVSFYLLDSTLYFNGCVEETDYLDLIAPAAEAERAWTAVFDCLSSSGFPQWQALNLCNVPEASPTRTILTQLARQRGFSFQESLHEVCPVIQLPTSFDAYLDSIDSKQRREIRLGFSIIR